MDVLLPAVCGLGLLVFVAFAAAPRETNRGEPILTGADTVDFGVVQLNEPALSLRHIFLLRNRSKDTVTIRKITTTCGCTAAAADVDRVPPGGDVRVSASLELTDTGTREAQVHLVADRGKRGEVVVLTLRATARRPRQLRAVDRHLELALSSSAAIRIYTLEYESDDPPIPPSVSAPAGLTVTFEGWALVHPRHAATGHPARWEGRIVVNAVGAPSGSPTLRKAMVDISSADSPTISIPVQVR